MVFFISENRLVATQAVTLYLIYYQLQQETVFYPVEVDPVKKEQYKKYMSFVHTFDKNCSL